MWIATEGRAREVDVRIVAATNRTLLDEVAAGRFREGLYYRLAVVQVTIPPLQDRSGDVPALAGHLLARIAKQPGLRELGITDEAMSLLGGYVWPGNVRQLQNALFRTAVLCDSGALTVTDFPHIASLLVARALVADHGPQAAGRRRHTVPFGWQHARARSDRSRRYSPGHRALQGPDDRSRKAAGDRTFDTVSQAV